MKDIPKKIYLQIGQEDSYDDVESFKEFSEISWCSHKMHDSDIEYILAGSELEGKELAILFHETYERLAPSFGYETRPDTKAFDPESPNGKLMIAVCEEILKSIGRPEGKEAVELWDEAQKYINTKCDNYILTNAA